jgi:glyoxylase-like metal-dependent hydrolase (beta-lactamase superfamily II)
LIVVISSYINFRKAANATMPSDTKALNDSVWCIRDRFVNAYIFKGKDGYIMFDAGIGIKNFNKQLEKLDIKPKKVSAILLTHTDTDHTGALPLFKNAILYMHRDEEQMINGKTGKTKYAKNKWKSGPYTLLNDYDTLNINGLKIRIVLTPGHTPGSICFIVGNDYLISGDNLIVKDGKYKQYPDKLNKNTSQQIESLKKFPDPSEFKYILTAHYGVVKN